jgi:hypothetical protein
VWKVGPSEPRYDLKGKEKLEKELDGGTRQRRRIKMKKRWRRSGRTCTRKAAP